MYIPSSFAVTDLAVLHRTMADHPFATLVTSTDGLPEVTHLPLILDPSRGTYGTLIGHVARVNPHVGKLSDGSPSLAIFHGPHAYVSPAWYRTTPSVPTWNYVAVHASGVPRVLTSEDSVHAVLTRTTAAFEHPESPYRMDELPTTFLRQMARAVVAFEIEIEHLEGKYKLSQNRTADDRQGVVEGLSHGDEIERQVGELMKAHA